MTIKVTYGTKEKVFKSLDKARAFRDKKKHKYSDIVISVSPQDADQKIAGVDFTEALNKLTELKL